MALKRIKGKERYRIIMAIRIILPPSDIGEITNICNSLWGNNKCPNEAMYIIKKKDSNDFAIMCESHYTGYLTLYGNSDIDVLPFTLDKATELNDIVLKEIEELTKEKD